MKILFVGDLSSYARARQRFLTLQDLGHEVKGLPWVRLEAEQDSSHKPHLWSRIRYKLRYPSDPVGINQTLPTVVATYKPDLVWIEKATTIWPRTYQQLKHQTPELTLVYYSEDDIYLPHNRSVYLERSLHFFDWVYTTKPRNLQELPKLGANRVFCVFQAYDQALHRPISVSPAEQSEWGSDVGFIGTFEIDRAETMLFLAKQGIRIRIWGSNWQHWKYKHPNLVIEAQSIYQETFVKAINTTKINLNFLRKLNRDQHTSRSLEIPACGGFMLTERTEEHQQLFHEGKEAEFFDCPDELLSKLKYYLVQEDDRQKVAQAGRRRCLKSGYSHHDRLKLMLENLK
jgi:spore maturation protein CgeB